GSRRDRGPSRAISRPEGHLLSLNVCLPGAVGAPPPPRDHQRNREAVSMRRFGKESRQIRARAGKPFSIELEGRPSPGSVAPVRDPPPTVRVVEDTPQPGPGIGGTAPQRFVVTPLAPGNVRLVFEYGRPWENKPHETYEVLVQIEA